MELYEELEGFYKNGTSIEKIYDFLIGCVEAQLKFRSSGVVERAVNVMKLYLDGVVERSEVAKLDWYLEAEAFELDHFIEHVDKDLSVETIHDLKIVEESLGFNRDQALYFLRDLAFFIDEVACFIAYSENGLPRRRYSQFLNNDLFHKSFIKNA
ncbi:MAG: hypothetical protein ABJJ44_11395 [Paraglaciecola sp.]|uniref:hypothetical protein n=1 Tax=Paraglaciecola sp. TaxID=1920173 RepID=UPI0032970577